MKSSLFTIIIITISIALFSVCVVSATDAKNIDLRDSDFDSELLLVDYTIQSSTQELGNKPVDTRYDNGEYIKNMEDTPASSIKYDDLQKEMEDILSPYMHKDSQNSGFKSDSRVLLVDYTIQSSTQELGNKPVDTRYDNGEYIKNTENMPVSSIKYDDLQKEMEDILSPYMHKDSQNSGF
ncbi:hypothetical protein [uncultured Methanobrevibacter sp.]|uniref:hypothetical protein n=1 Tax=uncultured Methanobrevibacter sp. TaxID=253161 RepID=UPI0025ECB2AA|nr:hypothetical protein [uncultured Methanobrevibacter sp.]